MISILLIKMKLIKELTPLILIMTVMSIIFIYIFGISFDQTYIPKVYIIDEDETATSRLVVEKFLESSNYNFYEIDHEGAIEALEGGDGIGAIYIESGFEQGLSSDEAKVILYKNSTAIELMTLESSISMTISEIKMNAEFSKDTAINFNQAGMDITDEEIYEMVNNEKSQFPVVEIVQESYEGDLVAYDSQKHSFAGFLIFFSLFTIMFGIGTIVEEKEYKVFDRQLLSPLRVRDVILGNLLGNAILGVGQIGVIIIFSRLVFGIEWGGSTMALLLVLFAFTGAGTAIGLFITSLVNTQKQLSAILPTFIVSTSMIGGCMWPLDIINSKVLLFIANLTPQKWAMSGVESVVSYNGQIQDVLAPIGILSIFTVSFLGLAVYLYKKLAIK